MCGTEVVQERDRGGCSRRTTGNLVVLFLFFIVGAVVAVSGGEGGRVEVLGGIQGRYLCRRGHGAEIEQPPEEGYAPCIYTVPMGE